MQGLAFWRAPTPAPRDDHMNHTRSPYLPALLLLETALLLAAACNAPAPTAAPPAAPISAPDPAPMLENRFVGNNACAGCHSREFQAHKGSFHASTARPVAELANIVLPQGVLFHSRCRLRREGRDIVVSVGFSKLGAEKLQYGLGSGKTGITFVTITNKNALFEMRASYFTHARQWYSTPGHRDLSSDEMGLDYPSDGGRLCMSCHTTTLPATGMTPDPRFLGVGCEACHGPAGDHIAAVKRNDLAHLAIDRLGAYGAEKLNTLCGRCHRTGQNVMDRSPRLATETQRFQAYGIMKSRCFKESKDRLSCLTCHNPHMNASLDMRSYEKACLSCHASTQPSGSGVSTGIHGKACPVRPRDGCIACHMPARKLIPQAERSPEAVDHFIQIPAKGSRPSPFHAL